VDPYDRVGRALSFIEAHLTDDMDLTDVAAQASSSLYWFHRVFAAVVGDTLAGYIRKRRLNCAALQLVGTDRRIIDIALDHGFGSQEAFTRSFRDHFAMTPARYRRAGLPVIRKAPMDIEQLRRERAAGGRGIMETKEACRGGVRVIELPPARLATSQGHRLDEFNAWWMAIDRQRSDKFYPRDFMYFDLPSSQLIWLYALPDSVTDTSPFDTVQFPGGLYGAGVSIDQNDVDGERVFAAIREWVEKTGCLSYDGEGERKTLFHVITSDAAFDLLRYRQLDIYVPVKAKQE
jgi:AraC-like DNA-binding protein